jgi:threonylcarbamoyladenosine tRNA methylthiotransferase MtaB
MQSGSDHILRLMRRRYTTKDYRDLIVRIRERIPNCGIGADVITGFPGETEEHFEETCRFIEDLPLSYLHVFTYSERPDTPAASSADQIRPEVRYRRSRVLRLLGKKKRSEFFSAMVGRTARVLLEGELEDGLRFGLTENYVRVGVAAEGTVENEFVFVRITGAGPEYCTGHGAATSREYTA